MPSMKRRHFLQFAGSALAAMGLSQADFLTQASRYRRAIAQTTPRKLALLIGINDYPFANGDLQGCLTDVELQYELLTHRYGFNPTDIVKISDNEALKPNRETILTVFQEHLINQARPGDVVVFHYSGHGARIIDPDPIDSDYGLNGTIVPNDPIPATAISQDQVTVPDIMGRTMFLLMEAIQTQNLTVVLDSCFSGGGTRGNSVVRAAPSRLSRSGETLVPSEVELAYQQELLTRLNLTFKEFQQRRATGIAKGLALGSALRDQEALDLPFGDFHAGAFTYVLTRYLWQLAGSSTAESIYVNLRRSTQAIANTKERYQVPTFDAAPDSNNEAKPLYFVEPQTGPAEAVIRGLSGKTVEFWLGGVSSQLLEATDAKSPVFNVLGQQRQLIAQIQQTHRAGLIGFGTVEGDMGALEPGMLLRETIVGLSANPQLNIGVDRSLDSEMDTAQAALNEALLTPENGSQIIASPVNRNTVLDYVLARMTAQMAADIAQSDYSEEIPPVGTLALFTPTLVPIPGTFGGLNESVIAAVNRLKSKLKLLLVHKILNALAETTSDLPIEGEIFTTNREDPVVPITQAGIGRLNASRTVEPFRSGDKLKIRVTNRDRQQRLYLSCLVIDDSGSITVAYPARWDAPEEAALIEPESGVVIPQPRDRVKFQVAGSGFLEVLTLLSVEPLRTVLRALQEIARNRGQSQGFLGLENQESVDLLRSVLGDIDQISRGNSDQLNTVIDEDQTVVDSGAIAVFSTVIEVTEPEE